MEVDFKFIFRIRECVTTATVLHRFQIGYVCPFPAHSYNVDNADEKYS